MLNQSMISVTLKNPYTGELSLYREGTPETFSVTWTLEADRRTLQSGNFSLSWEAGRKKDLPLSLEIPPLPPETEAILRVTVKNTRQEQADFSFPLPLTRLQLPPPPQPQPTAFRANASAAFFSAGEMTGRAEAAGLQELTGNGFSFFVRPPRFHCLPLSWRPEELPLLKVIPDRFDTDQGFARAHALVLPRGNEEDELEVTQTFLPLPHGVVQMDFSFIVPESFAPLGELGVTMEIDASGAQISALREKSAANAEIIHPQPGSSWENISFLAFREGEQGTGAMLLAASTMRLSVLPGGSSLFCGIDSRTPLSRGCYHLQLFAAALHPGEDPAETGRKIRVLHG